MEIMGARSEHFMLVFFLKLVKFLLTFAILYISFSMASQITRTKVHVQTLYQCNIGIVSSLRRFKCFDERMESGRVD